MHWLHARIYTRPPIPREPYSTASILSWLCQGTDALRKGLLVSLGHLYW